MTGLFGVQSSLAVLSAMHLKTRMVQIKIVARFRSAMALRPVQRIKHIVDSSATNAKGVNLVIPLVAAKDAPVLANTTEVITGSKVYGIYIKAVIASNDPQDVGVIPNVYLAIRKNPAGLLATGSIASLGDQDDKRYYLHQEMSMIENKGQGGNATVLFNGVVKIPKGFSRLGPNDLIEIIFLCPALDTAVCVQAHYKEFR